MCETMYSETEYAKQVLKQDSPDLDAYFFGVENLSHFLDHHDFYVKAGDLVRTWVYNKPFYRMRDANEVEILQEANKA